MKVGRRGFPILGEPVDFGAVLDKPSDDPPESASVATDDFSYYGHHQYCEVTDDGIRLGRVPRDPVNEYRCGEKIVLNHEVPRDFEASVTIDFLGDEGARDAGILFRCSGASVGYDAQRGYFAGLIPRTGLVILGKTDGANWKELSRAATQFAADQEQRLSVQMSADEITVSLNGQRMIVHRDETYQRGSVGLRVVNTDARFSDLRVEPVEVANGRK
jgi:hypothetical protein